MSLRLITLGALVLGLSACTTVDFSSMGNNPHSVSRPTLQKNVVERSVGQLQAVFVKKKLCARGPFNKMEAAAQVLLKGMKLAKSDQDMRLTAYSDSVPDIDTLKSDIVFATGHIVQTTKAAEVFLDTASDDMTFRKELQNLERALGVSHEAKERFTLAIDKFGRVESGVWQDDDWRAFQTSIESLRRVTDEFGDRVRKPITPILTAAS